MTTPWTNLYVGKKTCNNENTVKTTAMVFIKMAYDGRNRISNNHVPTSKEVIKHDELGSNVGGTTATHQMLLKSGIIRQSSAGIYSILPYGQRILEKLEKIIDREMRAIGAAKLSLPTLQTSTAWEKTGRWTSFGAELFKLQDRRNSELCLAPTHEEEITQLVAGDVSSYRQLPLRLYQINRKFRDEKRPRGGLLRGKEFLMKDLYTFDSTSENALQTYEDVCKAYKKIFDALGVEYVEAEADSGSIGGTRSHEYHYLSSDGEDTVLTCKACGYTASEERAEGVKIKSNVKGINNSCTPYKKFKDEHSGKITLVVYNSEERQLNYTRLPREWKEIPHDGQAIIDEVIVDSVFDDIVPVFAASLPTSLRDYTMVKEGDLCPRDNSPLTAHRAIEVGHTFYLGDKYSSALDATFDADPTIYKGRLPFQMGCYGIGISRLVAAIASKRLLESGIVWPPCIAPYRICILGNDVQSTREVYDTLTRYEKDVIWDDRDPSRFSFGFKMRDAMLQGYPYVIVLGKKFENTGKLEVWLPFNKTLTRSKDMMSLKELLEIVHHS